MLCLLISWLKKDKSAVPAIADASIDLVFPFRAESWKPLAWAVENGGGWKAGYMFAMLNDYLGYKEDAAEMIKDYSPCYAPFYAYRNSLTGSPSDLEKAILLDSEQWRYVQKLSLKYYDNGEYDKAIKVVEPYYLKHRDNFHVGDTYLKILIAQKQYRKADKVIGSMRILPFEGQTGSHVMWRDIKLHLAAECIDRGNYKAALERVEEALQWPENLGVGKPYDDLIDISSETLLQAVISQRMGDSAKAEEYMSVLRDDDGSKAAFFKTATVKVNGKYPKISQMLGNMDSSLDKKLF